MRRPWLERLRERHKAGPRVERPSVPRLYLVALVAAAWLFWLPWAYATAVHSGDWNYYVAPFFVGILLALDVVLSWVPASGKKYLNNGRGYLVWLAVGLPVAFMTLTGWEGGYEVGGMVFALIGVIPAVLAAWALLLLWRHRRADWRDHEQTGPTS